MRVELSPHLDAWMQGDRLGYITKTINGIAYVKMDVSGRTLHIHIHDCKPINPPTSIAHKLDDLGYFLPLQSHR